MFYPTSGIFCETSAVFNSKKTGSEYDFYRIEADLRCFIGIHKSHVMAFQFKEDFTGGSVPFQSLAGLGGNEIMRGIMYNRYMDKTSMAVQAEYRFPLFWRLAGALFAGTGEVQETVSACNISDMVLTAGGGLIIIIDSQKHIAARIDSGFNDNGDMKIPSLITGVFPENLYYMDSSNPAPETPVNYQKST